jgi:tetratricopeptide (TPR) repeat protein
MWRLQFARADMRAAHEFALKCKQVSDSSGDPVASLGASFALGATCLFNGDCSAAAPHLEDSIELYRRMEDKSALAVFGQDPGLSSLAYLSWAQWLLGFPDRAVASCEEAVQLARDIDKPVLIAVATGFAGLTYLLRRDVPRLVEYAEECKSICDRHEFRQHAAMSNVMLGYACSYEGDHDRAIALVEDGLEEKIALRSNIALPWFCYLAAETYVAADRLGDALAVAQKGIDFASRGGERFFEPENHRIQAVILAKDSAANRQEIEVHYDNALRLARSQKAKSLELRAAVSSARFALDGGSRESARELLLPVYDSFTEGFTTSDLEEARALREELA